MKNLALLLSCSKSEFFKVVKSEHVKCNSLDCYIHCTIYCAGNYGDLVNMARDFNRQSNFIVWFVYMTIEI